MNVNTQRNLSPSLSSIYIYIQCCGSKYRYCMWIYLVYTCTHIVMEYSDKNTTCALYLFILGFNRTRNVCVLWGRSSDCADA